MRFKLLPCTIFLISLCTVFAVFLSEIHAVPVPVTVPVDFNVSEENGKLFFDFMDENGEHLYYTSIEKELQEFGGLFSTGEGYAAVFASAYPVNYRIVFYNTEFTRIASKDIESPEAALPFISGGCSFIADEDGYYLADINLLNTPISDIEFIGDEIFILNKDMALIDTKIRIYDREAAADLKISLFEKDGVIYELTENQAADSAGITAISLKEADQAISESLSISGCAEKYAELKMLSSRHGRFCLHMSLDNDLSEEKTALSGDVGVSEDAIAAWNDGLVQEVSIDEDSAEQCVSAENETSPIQSEAMPSSEAVMPVTEISDTAEVPITDTECISEDTDQGILPISESSTAAESADSM